MAIHYSYPTNKDIKLSDNLFGSTKVEIDDTYEIQSKNFTISALIAFIISRIGDPGAVVLWGDIIGNIGEQEDLISALNLKTNKSTVLTINDISYNLSTNREWVIDTTTAEWGKITGVLRDQTDLKNVLDLKADLVNGLVPAYQLPSFVDDVIEVANYAALPVTGETGKIYITLNNNKVYRWSGSVYIEIAANQAIWGSITGTLSSQTDLQNALNAKQNVLGGAGLVKSTLGTISYIQDNSSNWNTAYNKKINSAAVTENGSTKTLSLNQQDGMTITASWEDNNSGEWGHITGTLSDQTDLQGELNAKVPTARTISINGISYDLSANRSWTITAGVWGQITGTLSNQTDLQNELNAKAPIARTLTINGTTLDLSANRSWTVPTHNPVGIGTSNGLSVDSNQQLYLSLSSGSSNGALSASDWNTFNGKLSGSGTPGRSARFTSSGTVGNGALTDDGTNVSLSGSITASGGFFNSDIRLKKLVEYNYNVTSLEPIEYVWKDGRDDKRHVGYSAQEVQKIMPDAINIDSNGILSVNYIEVLVAKIAEMEKEIKFLKSKL